jgi:hypothetical protein
MPPQTAALNDLAWRISRAAFPIRRSSNMSTWPYRIAREQRAIRSLLVTASVILSIAACSDDDYDDDFNPTEPPPPTATIVTASGAIGTKVDEYRALLGEPRNGGNVVGPAQSGRREVNWEGVNGVNLNSNAFPADFFARTTKLGLQMSTPGAGLRVSDNDFADLATAFGDVFNAFSPAKTFIAVGSPIVDVTFEVAGGTAPALVAGFGVVFADVDVASQTKLEAFDKAGKKLGTFIAPVRSNDATGHSFVGFKFASAIVARVRITSGTGALGAQAKDITNGGTADLVVMDDFLYTEPVPQ